MLLLQNQNTHHHPFQGMTNDQTKSPLSQGVVNSLMKTQVSQTHVSRKRERLIHECVTRCVTQCEVTRGTVMGNEIWSVNNYKYFEIEHFTRKN